MIQILNIIKIRIIFLLNNLNVKTVLKFTRTNIVTITVVKSGIKGPVIKETGKNNIR